MDLIERQTALNALANYIHNVDKVYSTGKLSADDCKDAAHSVLDDLPSAQPQRMRGRWLEIATNHTYICSICGRILVNITDGKNTVTKNYPFCHCGADMRGGEQDGQID